MSFRVAVSACARIGSNGAVFDAIAATDPLLYLQLGDFHYGNLDGTDAASFRAADERQLVQPGQAALYRRVPVRSAHRLPPDGAPLPVGAPG